MNRRAFFVQLQTEIARSVRYGHPPTLLYLDIDRFKQVNDSYGHAAGDAVIRAVIERIRSALRSGLDLVGRIGGDEFAILLPETQLAGAHVVAERIRQIVTEKPVLVIERIIPVTVSIGIAAWIAPEHPEQPSENVDDWVARADAALYNAKHRGRNQVCEAAPAGDSAPARATG